MTWPTFYEQIKYWLPVVTFLLLCYKGYASAEKKAESWMGTLLDNHLTHVQAATESMAESMSQLVSCQKESTAALSRLATAQNELVLGIEILKDRSSQARSNPQYVVEHTTKVSPAPSAPVVVAESIDSTLVPDVPQQS